MHFYSSLHLLSQHFTSSHNSCSKPRSYTSRILGRRFTMTVAAYKYRHQCGALCSLWKCSLVIIMAYSYNPALYNVESVLSRDVLILNDSCNQPRFHHYRFKIWLWNL